MHNNWFFNAQSTVTLDEGEMTVSEQRMTAPRVVTVPQCVRVTDFWSPLIARLIASLMEPAGRCKDGWCDRLIGISGLLV